MNLNDRVLEKLKTRSDTGMKKMDVVHQLHTTSTDFDAAITFLESNDWVYRHGDQWYPTVTKVYLRITRRLWNRFLFN